MRGVIGSIGWMVVVVCLGEAIAAEPLGLAEERAFRAAVDRIAGAVVRVEAVGVSLATAAGGAEAAPASGPSTGLVVDSAGWIVATSFAVPDDVGQAVVVMADGEGRLSRLAARVVGRDVSRGLVLLRVDAPVPLAAVTSVVPRDALSIGQWTIAVGRGWDASMPNVAVGILSAANRAWGKAVQTDASVSPANYGGPLIDIEGRVIGILAPLAADTAGMNLGTELYDSGIGFAVPLEDVLRVLPRLQKGENLSPGLLGITYRSRDAFTGDATIAAVRSGSPAAAAGLLPGDTIVAASGRPVSRIAQLRHHLLPLYAGDSIDLVVERKRAGAAPERLTVRPKLTADLPPWRRSVLGIVPRRVAAGERGEAADQPVVVDWVWPGSPAAAAGLSPGTVIETVTPTGDGAEPVPVSSASALTGVLGGVDVGEAVTVDVKDAGGTVARHVLRTVAVPGDIPADATVRHESPDAATVVKLEAAELPNPPLAVIPSGEKADPVGVLVYMGPPGGPVAAADADRWKAAANRYGVAIILPGSSDPQRWSRDDLRSIARSIDALRSRRAIDGSRLAVAGTGAGGAFAWLAAEALGQAIRGVVLLDASLPRQARVEAAEPGRGRWVVFGGGERDESLEARITSTRETLIRAGYDVSLLPERQDDGIPAETLCSFVEALGLL